MGNGAYAHCGVAPFVDILNIHTKIPTMGAGIIILFLFFLLSLVAVLAVVAEAVEVFLAVPLVVAPLAEEVLVDLSDRMASKLYPSVEEQYLPMF